MDDANLPQAGADSAFNSDGTTTFSVWFEWIPNNPFTIDSLLINPGDLIAVLIRTAGAGSTTAAIYIIDVTIGCFTSFEIDAPRDTNFGAGTAEWIVAAPSTLALPDYGQVFFSNAVAGLAGDGAIVNAGGAGETTAPRNLIVNGVTMSTGTIVSPTVVQCQYIGPEPTTNVSPPANAMPAPVAELIYASVQFDNVSSGKGSSEDYWLYLFPGGATHLLQMPPRPVSHITRINR